ncbi:DUF2480 family protein [Aureisphaera galaxeae]|uniref:DUF2480 family protein n=1 Tax=Aureisphaera galaxeae TaxID=1538023 RepID=UPI002350E5B9|nr:DUF2480 family protein [Aureisphaera galaxeae]MDC8002602.1 DUF2480 family protein [Aureisphaera galaxeae]
MEKEIVNRVANSPLVTIDLEELYPAGERMELDISQWLYEGLILREKEYREHINNHDWDQYKDAYVFIHCATDAIIPGWAFLLVSLQLSGIASKVHIGSREEMEASLYMDTISNLDLSEYQDKPVIIKGCSDKYIPDNAYVQLAQRLQPLAKSIMYGEACSSVPLYKRKK